MAISALLKNSETIRKRIQQQQDNEVAYEWQLSAKTYDDFVAYSSYVQDQAKRTNDPAELLSYRKATDSARSGFISNEIQRQTLNVLEGRSSNTDKKAAITQLYYTAAENGNYDLAQSLNLQIDNLDIKIQQEQEAAQRLAGSLASMHAASVEDAVDQLKGYSKELSDIYRTTGIKEFTDQTKQYSKQLGIEPGDFFGMQIRIADQINQVYDSAIASESDPSTLRKFQKAKNGFLSGNSLELPSINGSSLKVSYQDLIDQADAARTGQTIFRTVKTSDGTVFEKNKETGFVWGRTADGSYRAISLYKPSTDYTSGIYKTKIDSKGNVQYLDNSGKVVAIGDKSGNIKDVNGGSIKDAAKRDYQDLLKQNGLNIISHDGGYIEVATPQEWLDKGISTSETTQLYVNNDGKLQVAGDGNQLYDFNFDEKTGEFKGLLKDVPNAITMLNDNFSKEFLDTLDKSRLPAGTIGIVDNAQASTQLLKVGEFTRADIADKERLAQLERIRAEQAQQQVAAQLQQTAAINAAQSAAANLQASSRSAQVLQPAVSAPQLQPTRSGASIQGSGAPSTGAKINVGANTQSKGISLGPATQSQGIRL